MTNLYNHQANKRVSAAFFSDYCGFKNIPNQ